MFTHEQIWQAIDRLAQAHGYSASGLAKKAGLDPTTFNKSKRTSADGKPRWPSTESLSKILAVTGATLTDMLALADAHEHKRGLPVMDIKDFEPATVLAKDGLPRGKKWDTTPIIFTAPDGGSFALTVSHNRFAPFYRKGRTLIIAPEHKLKKDQRLLIQFTKSAPLLLRDVQKADKNQLALCPPDSTNSTDIVKIDDAAWIGRIIWAGQ